MELPVVNTFEDYDMCRTKKEFQGGKEKERNRGRTERKFHRRRKDGRGKGQGRCALKKKDSQQVRPVFEHT